MIYHIARRGDWESARFAGQYSAPSLDREGFIHCSTRDQVLSVANAHFRGQMALLLLCINEMALSAQLKWEPPAHPGKDPTPEVQPDERFPHVYGPVNLKAIVAAFEFNAGGDGFKLPANLPG